MSSYVDATRCRWWLVSVKTGFFQMLGRFGVEGEKRGREPETWALLQARSTLSRRPIRFLKCLCPAGCRDPRFEWSNEEQLLKKCGPGKRGFHFFSTSC
jgi:hypothetical protein